MFLKLNTFFPSANSVQSSRPTRRPLVTRTSTFLNQDIVWLFGGPLRVHSRPQLPGVSPSSAGLIGEYGRPLANRNVTNAPTFRRISPSVVPFSQSLGKLSAAEPTMLWVRLSSVGRVACGGGLVCPVRLEIWRPSRLVNVNGSEPVFLASCSVYEMAPENRFENRRSSRTSMPRTFPKSAVVNTRTSLVLWRPGLAPLVGSGN